MRHDCIIKKMRQVALLSVLLLLQCKWLERVAGSGNSTQTSSPPSLLLPRQNRVVAKRAAQLLNTISSNSNAPPFLLPQSQILNNNFLQASSSSSIPFVTNADGGRLNDAVMYNTNNNVYTNTPATSFNSAGVSGAQVVPFGGTGSTTSPYFLQRSYVFQLTNCAAGNTVVGTVQAQNPTGATLVYTLSDSANNAFSINSLSGQITYIGGGSNTYVNSYNPQTFLTVQVSDSRGGVDTAQVTVLLQCNNNNNGGGGGGYGQAPVFSQSTYTFTVSQCAYGAAVGNVYAIDPNGDLVQYSISPAYSANAYLFNLDPTSGQLTIGSATVATLTALSYLSPVQVQATDLHGNFGFATVCVVVQCSNGGGGGGNYYPTSTSLYFSQPSYTFSVFVCTPNAYVGSVYATSVSGGQVQYTLQQQNTGYSGFGGNQFSINQYTGQITLSSTYGLQSGGATQLYVQAYDNRGGSAQATVSVYSSCGGSSTNNGQYYYPTYGNTYATSSLPYYYGAGTATNGYSGYSPYSSTNQNTYYNYPVNSNYYTNTVDRQPYFSQSSYSFYDQCTPNAALGTVMAQDPDNDRLQYSIVYNSGSYNGAYTINPYTGTITRSSSSSSSYSSFGSSSSSYYGGGVGVGSGGTSSFQVLANDLRGRSAVATVTVQSQCSSNGGINNQNTYYNYPSSSSGYYGG